MQFVDIAATGGSRSPGRLRRRRSRKKYILETNGCGIAFFDYDNDGWLDIFVPGGSARGRAARGHQPALQEQSRRHVHRRNQEGRPRTRRLGLRRLRRRLQQRWTTTTCSSVAGARTSSTATTATAPSRTSPEKAGLLHAKPEWGAGCTFIDYDRDGYLDLFVSTYLDFDFKTAPLPGATENCMWKGIAVNCGPKRLAHRPQLPLPQQRRRHVHRCFAKPPASPRSDKRYAMTAVAADFDDDGWPDIFVACDSTPSILYRNNHDGTFTDIALEAGVAYNEDGREQAGMGVARRRLSSAQGRLDIFKTHFADDTPILYRNKGKGRFEDITAAPASAASRVTSAGAPGFADFDNDGLPDLFFVNGNVYPEIEQLLRRIQVQEPADGAAQSGQRNVRERQRRSAVRESPIPIPAAAVPSAISTTTATWTCSS